MSVLSHSPGLSFFVLVRTFNSESSILLKVLVHFSLDVPVVNCPFTAIPQQEADLEPVALKMPQVLRGLLSQGVVPQFVLAVHFAIDCYYWCGIFNSAAAAAACCCCCCCWFLFEFLLMPL